ncbi:unnamed protein product [Larinioides sclopetarius]|uniref:Uncharacterized protein n=1 Tax=Larinioides sclopetarius TaxID=280406 RepID=A0AAV2AG59_9ARAC
MCKFKRDNELLFLRNMNYFILILVLYFGIFCQSGLNKNILSNEQLLEVKSNNFYNERFGQKDPEFKTPKNKGEPCYRFSDCKHPLICE